MTRKLVVEEPVEGRPGHVVERFREEPSSWLPLPNERHRRHHWWTYLWAGDVGVLVDTTVAAPFSQAGVVRRLVRLEPDRLSLAGRLAPSLEGDLVVRRKGEGAAVCLDGSYKVPFGAFGDFLNVIFLHRFADAGARRFVKEVGARLGDSPSPAKDKDPGAARCR